MMKNRIVPVLAILVIVFAVFLLNSCDLAITKEQRISLFVDDLNQDPRPNSIRYNFSPSCAIYATLDGAFFSTDFQTDSIPYSVYNLNLNADPVTGTISGTGTGGTFGGPWSIEFTMVKDGLDWLILKLRLQGTTIVQ